LGNLGDRYTMSESSLGWIHRISIYTMGGLSKGQSFPLESIMEYLYNFGWGSLFLCEKSPSNCTRNSPNPFWVSAVFLCFADATRFEGFPFPFFLSLRRGGYRARNCGIPQRCVCVGGCRGNRLRLLASSALLGGRGNPLFLMRLLVARLGTLL
jgi:hypothetical protein